MTAQLPLDFAPGYRPPMARRADPISSHAAADRLERTGRADAQRQAVLAAVCAHPGLTSRQLAEAAGLDRHMVGRRAPELGRAGLIRRVEDAPGAELRLWPA